MEEPRGLKVCEQAPPVAQALETVRFIEPGDPNGGPGEMPLLVYDERHALISARLREKLASWVAPQ